MILEGRDECVLQRARTDHDRATTAAAAKDFNFLAATEFDVDFIFGSLSASYDDRRLAAPPCAKRRRASCLQRIKQREVAGDLVGDLNRLRVSGR